MTLRIGGAAVKPSGDGVLFDLWEAIDGPVLPTTPTPTGGANFGAVPQFFTANGGQFWNGSIGAGGSLQSDPSFAYQFVRIVSGAAVQGQSNSLFRLPWHQRISAAGSPKAADIRPFLRYTLSTPIRVPVPGTAIVEFGQSNAGLTAGGTTAPGCAWVSNPAVAGGALSAQYRLVNAGAVTVAFQSAIVPPTADWVKLGLRYTEGPTPTIEWLIDDAPVAVLSGQANMPRIVALSSQIFILTGAPAGTTLERYASNYKVERIN